MSASSLFIYLQRLVCHKQDFAEKITKATGIERKTSLDLLNVKMITITHLNLEIHIFLLSPISQHSSSRGSYLTAQWTHLKTCLGFLCEWR